ncbi:MAG TPA: hypothetical protein VN428_00770 [Bryobacteraceae bacterium]|nr:hypothetical protein [Bryobacteraceae bacterium]
MLGSAVVRPQSSAQGPRNLANRAPETTWSRTLPGSATSAPDGRVLTPKRLLHRGPSAGVVSEAPEDILQLPGDPLREAVNQPLEVQRLR